MPTLPILEMGHTEHAIHFFVHLYCAVLGQLPFLNPTGVATKFITLLDARVNAFLHIFFSR